MAKHSAHHVPHWCEHPVNLDSPATSFPANWHSSITKRIYPTPQVRHKSDDETSRFIIRTLGFIYRTSRFITKNYLSSTERDVSYTERDVLYMANLIVDWPPQPISLKSLNNCGPPKIYIAFRSPYRDHQKAKKGIQKPLPPMLYRANLDPLSANDMCCR